MTLLNVSNNNTTCSFLNDRYRQILQNTLLSSNSFTMDRANNDFPSLTTLPASRPSPFAPKWRYISTRTLGPIGSRRGWGLATAMRKSWSRFGRWDGRPGSSWPNSCRTVRNLPV